jgi:hypothetical protein
MPPERRFDLSSGKQKLGRDLTILQAMSGEMDDYLKSEVLFWQMMKGGMPKLTLGGYLTRQHRLLALKHLLDESERVRLETAVVQFNLALVEKIVRLEQKAHRELAARIRQWGEYLKDIEWEKGGSIGGYGSAVETRAMIAALIDQLQMAPYQLDSRFLAQVSLLDTNLRRSWRRGAFVWPESWQPAYPSKPFWWLYGSPRRPNGSPRPH